MLLLAAMYGTAAQAASVPLNNGGFENDWVSTGLVGSDGSVTFFYRPAGPEVGWQFAGGGGVAHAYNLIGAYEGSRFGLLQLGNPSDLFGASGASFVQSFELETAATVELRFALAVRPGYAGGQSVSVAMDGQVLQTFAAQPGWHVQQLDLGLLSAGTHVLGFAGNATYGIYGDTTAFIDAVQLDALPVPEPETWVSMLAGLVTIGVGAGRRIRSARG